MSTERKGSTGQFNRGTSGNPSGRPTGSRNKATSLLEELLEGEGKQLIQKAIELALAGDTHALRLCLDRLVPPRKDRLVHFDLPPARSLDEISQGMRAILGAIAIEAALAEREKTLFSLDQTVFLYDGRPLKAPVFRLYLTGASLRTRCADCSCQGSTNDFLRGCLQNGREQERVNTTSGRFCLGVAFCASALVCRPVAYTCISPMTLSRRHFFFGSLALPAGPPRSRPANNPIFS